MKTAINQTNRTLSLNLAPTEEAPKKSAQLLPFGSRNAAGKLMDRIEVSKEDMKMHDLVGLSERSDITYEGEDEPDPKAEPVADDPKVAVHSPNTRTVTRS